MIKVNWAKDLRELRPCFFDLSNKIFLIDRAALDLKAYKKKTQDLTVIFRHLDFLKV
jgi:hypothetical protein